MRSRRDFLIAGSGAALASASAALAAAKPYAPNSAGSGVFAAHSPRPGLDWIFRTEAGVSGEGAAWNQPDVSTFRRFFRDERRTVKMAFTLKEPRQ